MRTTYRCLCGYRTLWTEFPPPACQACEKCGATLAADGAARVAPAAHDWEQVLVPTDEGRKPLTVCARCNAHRRDIEHPEEAAR